MANLVEVFWFGKHRNPPSQFSPALDRSQFDSLSPESGLKIVDFSFAPIFYLSEPFQRTSLEKSEKICFPNFPPERWQWQNGNASPRKGRWVGAFEPNWEVRRTSITPDQLSSLTDNVIAVFTIILKADNSPPGDLPGRRLVLGRTTLPGGQAPLKWEITTWEYLM